MTASVWEWLDYVFPRVSMGALIPQAARAGCEGLGCICSCLGVAEPCAYRFPLRGVTIGPYAHEAPEGLRFIRRRGGANESCISSYSRGASQSPKQPTQDRLHRAVHRCVRVDGLCVSP